MMNPAEAARLLAELPQHDALKATDEVGAWLESLARSTTFGTPAQRLKVISLVDEAGQAHVETLMAHYLESESRQKPDRFTRWQTLMHYWERVAEAYQELVIFFEASKHPEGRDQVPLVIARAMRAVYMQMRLGLMRYAGEPERTWGQMYKLFSSALQSHCPTSPVRLYPPGTRTTTARHELVAAVMLEAAAPQTLAPRQIELTGRVAMRVASAVAFSDVPADGFDWYLDLAKPRAPNLVPNKLQAAPTMRFLGRGTVVARLKETIERTRTAAPLSPDPELGTEFLPPERLETLTRLLIYWGESPPRRQHTRTRIATSVDVVFGLDAVMRVVGKGEQQVITSEKFEILFDDKRAADAKPAAAEYETWTLKDISLRGLGASTTRRAQGALRIGALMAFRLEDTEQWAVGVVRRLQVDPQKNSSVGAEIFSRSPRVFWLKKPGAPGNDAWDFETKKDDAMSHHFLKTVLLPKEKDGAQAESMLVEQGEYKSGPTYGARIDKDLVRNLRFGKVLEPGDHFERVAFEWVD